MIRFYCSRCHTLLVTNKEKCHSCGNVEISQIDINVQTNDSKNKSE
ncbi:hypothetical protein ACLM5H_09880 [Fredinandcohnia humi]